MSDVLEFDNQVILDKYLPNDDDLDDVIDMDDHNRGVLMDTGPEKLTFASDAPRRNNHSSTLINLRETGMRYKSEPRHHDINLSFTDKDPRGTTTDPNLSLMKEHTWRRKNNHKFVNDADYSVPSGTLSEAQIVKNKRNAREYVAKNYYKDFTTSKDGWGHSYHQGNSKGSKVQYTENSKQIMNLNSENNMNKRRDISTMISNTLPIGHLTTTDNVFNVANYNALYTQSDAAEKDIIKNSYKAEVSEKRANMFKENQIAKQLELFVSDIQRNKERMMNNKQDTKYGNSKDTSNKDALHKKESYDNRILHEGEHTDKKIKLIESILKNYKKTMIKFDKSKDFGKSNMSLPKTTGKNNDISTVLKATITKRNKLKSAMEETIESHNKAKLNLGNNKNALLYNNNHNKSNASRVDDPSYVDFNAIQRRNPDSGHAKMYKTNSNGVTLVGADEYCKDFDHDPLNNINTDVNSKNYKVNHTQADIMSKDDFETQNEFGDNKHFNRNNGSMGNKYLFKDHSDDHELDDINEKTSYKLSSSSSIPKNKSIFSKYK